MSDVCMNFCACRIVSASVKVSRMANTHLNLLGCKPFISGVTTTLFWRLDTFRNSSLVLLIPNPSLNPPRRTIREGTIVS